MKKIAFLFCCDYFDKTQPDEDYREEYQAVRAHGKDTYLFSLEAFLEDKKLNIAITDEPVSLLYRGWMLTANQYTQLYNALSAKGYTLLNSPQQYSQCHYLPSWYHLLKNETAESAWTKGVPDEKLIIALLAQFHNKPLIIKDYVKSRKHEWEEACFIPDAADTPKALAVIKTFISRQDDNLAGGIVLREYLPLNMIGAHDKSQMPIAKEVRIFCLHHQPFACIEYWSGEEAPMLREYQALINSCRSLDSHFYTIDLAQRTDGRWVIMEVGDGQVSGLQEFSAGAFYEKLLMTVTD